MVRYMLRVYGNVYDHIYYFSIKITIPKQFTFFVHIGITKSVSLLTHAFYCQYLSDKTKCNFLHKGGTCPNWPNMPQLTTLISTGIIFRTLLLLFVIYVSPSCRSASPLWATETFTQRPYWVASLLSSASLLVSSSTVCPYPSSSTSSQTITLSSSPIGTQPPWRTEGRWG